MASHPLHPYSQRPHLTTHQAAPDSSRSGFQVRTTTLGADRGGQAVACGTEEASARGAPEPCGLVPPASPELTVVGAHNVGFPGAGGRGGVACGPALRGASRGFVGPCAPSDLTRGASRPRAAQDGHAEPGTRGLGCLGFSLSLRLERLCRPRSIGREGGQGGRLQACRTWEPRISLAFLPRMDSKPSFHSSARRIPLLLVIHSRLM